MLYKPIQDVLYKHMQDDVLYKPMQDDVLYKPLQDDVLYKPMQKEATWHCHHVQLYGNTPVVGQMNKSVHMFDWLKRCVCQFEDTPTIETLRLVEKHICSGFTSVDDRF